MELFARRDVQSLQDETQHRSIGGYMYIKSNFTPTAAAARLLHQLGYKQQPGMRDGWAVWGNSLEVPEGLFQILRAGNPGMPSKIGVIGELE